MVTFHPNTSKNTTNNNVRSLKVDDWSNAHHVTIPSAVKQEAVWLSRDFILTNRKHFHLNFLKKWPPGPTGWTVENIKSSRWDWTRDGHVTEITSEMLQKVRVAVGGGGGRMCRQEAKIVEMIADWSEGTTCPVPAQLPALVHKTDQNHIVLIDYFPCNWINIPFVTFEGFCIWIYGPTLGWMRSDSTDFGQSIPSAIRRRAFHSNSSNGSAF